MKIRLLDSIVNETVFVRGMPPTSHGFLICRMVKDEAGPILYSKSHFHLCVSGKHHIQRSLTPKAVALPTNNHSWLDLLAFGTTSTSTVEERRRLEDCLGPLGIPNVRRQISDKS